MKRVGHLWPELTSFANLLGAAQAVAKGKRRRPDVAAFQFHLEPYLFELRAELLDGSYRPGPYRTFPIRDPKERLISAAPFRDRVVHHAFTRVVEPIFERRFSPYSFACRKGMGTHAALDVARKGVRHCRFALRLDVSKFFASVDHEILMEQLGRAVKCKPTLALAGSILDGFESPASPPVYFPGDGLFTPLERKTGLPLGNQTSQFFANVYLDGVDQLVVHRLRPSFYARYVDDLVLFDDSKERLRDMRAAVEAALEQVRLRLHPAKSRLSECRDGTPFLGWRLLPDRARLQRGNVVRFQRRMAELQEDHAEGRIDLGRVRESVRAWIGHAGYGDTWMLRKNLLSRFRFRRGVRPDAVLVPKQEPR